MCFPPITYFILSARNRNRDAGMRVGEGQRQRDEINAQAVIKKREKENDLVFGGRRHFQSRALLHLVQSLKSLPLLLLLLPAHRAFCVRTCASMHLSICSKNINVTLPTAVKSAVFVFVKIHLKGKKDVRTESQNRKSEFPLRPLPCFWLMVALTQQKSHTGGRLSCLCVPLCMTAHAGQPLDV